MSGAISPSVPGTPHLFSLVSHSKKAWQHGKQLCTRAHELTHATSSLATDVLALDAKARWTVQGISEQLKLATSIAKCIELQRSKLENRAKEWDKARSFHSGNLDSVLESLEKQVVPPDFHLSSSSSSIFASQLSDEEENPDTRENGTIRKKGKVKVWNKKKSSDRSRWKTLRDFIDFGSIVKATEEMDEDRDKLDEILVKTEDFPLILNENITSLQDSIPKIEPLPSIHEIFNSQEIVTSNMANHLEGLTSHYDEMAAALRDKESGEEISEEDLQEMNRDTDELPSIIADLEDDVASVTNSHNQLYLAKDNLLKLLATLEIILGRLTDLEGIMTEMLEQQQETEDVFEAHLASLQQYLTTIEHLYLTFTSYENSFNSLLIELERRRRFRDATEEIVKGMARQLDVLRNEEIQTRESFFSEHGSNLPDDLCLCVANMPTKWDVVPALGEVLEELPDLDEDLIVEATKHIDLIKDGTESL